jgi:hypothetical protein
MDDLMAWAQVDDGFYDHPKTLELLEHPDGAAAIGLWVLALNWARKQVDPARPEQAGVLPPSLPRRLVGDNGDKLAAMLVTARAGRAHGLWEETITGYWVIHDFAYWQQLGRWLARSQAAKAAAATRWSGQLPLPNADAHADAHADVDPDAYADAPIHHNHTTPHNGGTGRGKSSPSVGTRGSRLPADWKPSQRLLDWARSEASQVDPRRETAKFRDYWQAQPGQRAVKRDWDATWRNWMRKAAEAGSSPIRRPARDEIPEAWR